MDRSKDAVAQRLAQAHLAVEPGIAQIFRLLASGSSESDSEEPIKLLEVNHNTTADGIRPVFFGSHPASGFLYPSVIVEVTPEEFAEIAGGELTMPNGWSLGAEIPRAAVAATGV